MLQIGYCVGVIGEKHDLSGSGAFEDWQDTVLGLVFGAMSSFFVALYPITMKKRLGGSTDIWEMLFSNSVIAGLLLLPVCFGELTQWGGVTLHSSVAKIPATPDFWGLQVFG